MKAVFSCGSRERGFTLLEVLVALLISSIVIGSVMHAISTSLRLKRHSMDKVERWDAMQSVVAQILANPQKALALDTVEIDDERSITIEKRLVSETEAGELDLPHSYLVRIRLHLGKETTELSLMVPEEFDAPGGAISLQTMKSTALAFTEFDFDEDDEIELAQ